ncbi:unnamed protein product, partial [Cyprideis torosa]
MGIGEQVEEDQSILEVATDKVDTEIPTPVSGVIEKILCEENEVVAIGQPIAIIKVETDEEIEEEPVPVQDAPVGTVDEVAPQEASFVSEEAPQAIAPENEPVVQEEYNEVSSDVSISDQVVEEIENTQEEVEQILEAPIQEAPNEVVAPNFDPVKEDSGITAGAGAALAAGAGAAMISPLVRSICEVEGIQEEELQNIKGTGIDGRITKDDMYAYLRERDGGAANDEQLSDSLSQSNPSQEVVQDYNNNGNGIPSDNSFASAHVAAQTNDLSVPTTIE